MTLPRLAFLSTALLLLPSAHAQLQWDPGLTPGSPSGGAGTWDSSTANWSNGSTNTIWNGGTAVLGGATSSRTITVSGTQTITGITLNPSFVNPSLPYTLTGGNLSLSGAVTVQSTSTPPIGVVLNTNLIGSGSINFAAAGPQYSASLLAGTNTYTGGTSFASNVGLSAKNDASLGASGTAVTVTNSGYSNRASFRFDEGNVTTARNFSIATGVNLVLNSFTGPSTYNGVFSGGGSMEFSTYGSGSIALGAISTYAGETKFSGGSVTLDIDNAFPDTALTLGSSVSFNLGNHTETFGSLAVTSTSDSTIDFASGASSLTFADSSAASWSGTGQINITNFVTGTDLLRFGTDGSGLTIDQLARIKFGGSAAQIDSQGFVTPLSAVPEPGSAAALLGLAVLGSAALRRQRRR